MPVVTGMTLICSVGEDADDDSDLPRLFERINDWIEERCYYGRLEPLQERFGGNKHPQFYCIGAGLSPFPEDEFAVFAMSLPWIHPENVVLVMQPEDGLTKVFRPTPCSRIERSR